jgi:hypothetical protein
VTAPSLMVGVPEHDEQQSKECCPTNLRVRGHKPPQKLGMALSKSVSLILLVPFPFHWPINISEGPLSNKALQRPRH